MSSSFSPTQAEASLVTQIFNQYDTNKLGVLTGEVAVRAFGGAKLPPATLGEIWTIADDGNNGWLSRKGVAIALRLIGWVQKGEKVTPDLISKPGPLAFVEGLSPIATHSTGASIPKSPPPPGPQFPPFTPQDRAKFQTLFMNAGPVNGILTGEQARDFFVKSNLSNEKLLQIWNLADTQDRGFLDATDFAIGMYFIQGVMSGQIPVIPASLPPGLYQQVSGGAAVRTHATGDSYSTLANHSAFPQNRGYVQPQYTGQSILQPQVTGLAAQKKPASAPSLPARRTNPSQIGTSVFGAQQQNTGPSQQWDVTAAEKASSDGYFETLDTDKTGYIDGEVAVPFMLESKLPGEVLAHIWDLADLNNDGHLNRDGFAVAMHLIQKKLSGGEIPAVLPASLIPPPMRNRGASAIGASAFTPAQQPPEPARDLFSFDETPPASATAPPPSGPFSVPAQHTGAQTPNYSSPSVFAMPAPSQDPFASSGSKDLLGDDDDVGTTSPPLHDQSAEIGNTQNQLNSTNRSLETTKNERVSVEQSLANQAAQLSALQVQLSSAKAAYETETKLLSTARERYTTQAADIEKTRQELISAESDLSALRVEKAEIEGTYLRDKEEARELHRRMVETSQQAEVLKAETEKAKKEAKQQKGLLAIAKKQLSSKEAEKAKAEKELIEANAEAAAATQEKEEAEAELDRIMNAPSGPLNPVERAMSADSLTFAASQALPVTPDPASPGSISGKSNNPFERLAKSSNPSTPRSQSPFLPFANTVLPGPPITNGNAEKPSIEASLDDPFGFSQAFETPATTSNEVPAPTPADEHATPEVGSETPKITPPDLGISSDPVSSAADTPFSPSTINEEFMTPPTTATGQSEIASPAPARQTTEEIVSEKFPDLDDIATTAPAAATESNMPGHFGEPSDEGHHETDLTTSLKEIEEDESDSSDDEDEVPLAELAKAKNSDDTQPKPETVPTNGIATKAAEPVFDDIFNVSSPTATPAPAATETTDAFGAPVKPEQDLFGVTSAPTEAKPAEEGLSAFDEALGKVSGSGAAAPSPAPQFTFDSAFEDNFDFNAASASNNSFFPVPKAANGPAAGANNSDGFGSLFTSQPNGPPAGANNSDGFGSLFTSQPNGGSIAPPSGRPVSTFLPNVVPSQPVPASAPASAPAPAPAPGPSFDEVFSGFGSGPSVEPENPAPASPKANPPQATLVESPTQRTFPSVSTPPASHTGSPSRSSAGRSISPPPRVASPKLRQSTKDGIEKKETPAPRHSKLSIRLPFGKKKKQEQPPPPPPSQFLTPPQEEPARIASPAVDDDVEAVKQLTAMGFTRSQAVNALENHAYDIPRALNSLLGQQ